MALPWTFFAHSRTGHRTPDLTDAACEQSTLKVPKVQVCALAAFS